MRGLRTAASFNLNIEPCTPYTPEENKYEETLFHTVSCHDIFFVEIYSKGSLYYGIILKITQKATSKLQKNNKHKKQHRPEAETSKRTTRKS
jgi:hypothetical protein